MPNEFDHKRHGDSKRYIYHATACDAQTSVRVLGMLHELAPDVGVTVNISSLDIAHFDGSIFSSCSRRDNGLRLAFFVTVGRNYGLAGDGRLLSVKAQRNARIRKLQWEEQRTAGR